MSGTALPFWGFKMRIMVEKLLKQYGMEIRVGDRAVRALFQPVTGKLERLAVLDPGPAGLQSRGRYVYIGPVEPEVREDMVLTVAGGDYTVRSARQIFGSNGPLYYWAMCVEKGRKTDGL